MSRSNISKRPVQNLFLHAHTNFDINILKCGFQCNPLRDDPGKYGSWGPLIRDYYAFHYYTSGRGTLYINDVAYPIHSGQCSVSLPGTVIIEYTEPSDPREYYFIYLKGSSISPYLRRLNISESSPIFSWENAPQVLSCFQELDRLEQLSCEEQPFLQTAVLCRLFSELIRLRDFEQNTVRHASDEYIDQALRFLELNFYQNISVTELASMLGFNRSHFTRVFNRRVGMPPQEYLLRLRIKKACEFLSLPNATVSSVANSVGYDPFTFSKIFKKRVGVSPSAYKNGAV